MLNVIILMMISVKGWVVMVVMVVVVTVVVVVVVVIDRDELR